MKNLMDFCIGTVVFILTGFSLLLGFIAVAAWTAATITVTFLVIRAAVGNGKFFVYDVEQVVKVRTGELSYGALQGEE